MSKASPFCTSCVRVDSRMCFVLSSVAMGCGEAPWVVTSLTNYEGLVILNAKLTGFHCTQVTSVSI